MNIYSYRIDRINYLAIFLLLNVFNYSIFRYSVDGSSAYPAFTTISESFRLILSIIYFSFILKSSNFKSRHRWLILIFLLYVMGGLLSVLFNGQVEGLLYSIWVLASGMSVLSATKKQITLASILTLHFLLISLIIGLFYGLVPYSIAFSSKTYWPALLIMVIVILFYNNQDNNRTLLYLMIAIGFILLSGKRTALLISLVFLMLYYRKVFLLFAGLVFLIVVYLGSDIGDSFETIDRLQKISLESGKIVESNSSSSWSDRRWIFESYLSLWESNIMGVGIGQSQKAHSLAFSASSLAGYSPHNSFLAAFVEGGLLGGVGFFLIAVGTLFKNRGDIAKFLVVLMVCVQMYVESNSSPGQILFLPFLMLLRILW